MEHITSRKNSYIQYLRALGRERNLRSQEGEFLCDGRKLLREAVQCGAGISSVLWCDEPDVALPASVKQQSAPKELLQYASPMENSPGPLFTVRIREADPNEAPERVLVLENLQDPGNVGTVLRTAAAFRSGLVVLCGSCADPYNPKCVRASMGAIFRQSFAEWSLDELSRRLQSWQMPLYGAALHREAVDIRQLQLKKAAVAVGNEGNGLSEEILSRCDKRLIIPMDPNSESLNAAVAASVILWEMSRG